jgi:hypothetical protein
VHRALFVIEAAAAPGGEHSLVPDVGMHAQAMAAPEPEAHEILWTHVVPGQGQGSQERTRLVGEEHLPAIGMVVAVPQQQALRIARVRLHRMLGRRAVADDVVAAHRVVAAVEDVALPLRVQGAFPGAALISPIQVHRTPALRGPAHDFNGLAGGSLKKTSAAYRGEIAALKRRIPRFETLVKLLYKGVCSAKLVKVSVKDSGTQLRFRAAGFAALRKKLDISAAEMGKLLGVSGFEKKQFI